MHAKADEAKRSRWSMSTYHDQVHPSGDLSTQRKVRKCVREPAAAIEAEKVEIVPPPKTESATLFRRLVAAAD